MQELKAGELRHHHLINARTGLCLVLVFNLKTDKLVGIGHGIADTRFLTHLSISSEGIMAAPFLAPIASLVPVLKMLALGSVKFVGVGIGAVVAPVMTANFLVGLSAGTPLKYAKFRHGKGHFSNEQLDLIDSANQLVEGSIKNSDQHLSRSEAREFLKEILISTIVSMKQGVVSFPARLAEFGRLLMAFVKKPFTPND